MRGPLMEHTDADLANWNGVRHPLVVIDGERWMIKRRESQRELLGHLLARGHLNVPEVRPWGPMPDGRVFAAVRLTENYRRDQLPIPDRDEAVASELAFSAWTRRRDTHAYNRAYVGGVPMFFDHGAAFDPAETADGFIRNGKNNGFVARWRITRHRRRPTTLGVRSSNSRSAHALHPARDLDRVQHFLCEWTDRIEARQETDIAAAVTGSGWNGEGPAVIEQLIQWRDELRGVITKIRPLLTAPID